MKYKPPRKISEQTGTSTNWIRVAMDHMRRHCLQAVLIINFCKNKPDKNIIPKLIPRSIIGSSLIALREIILSKLPTEPGQQQLPFGGFLHTQAKTDPGCPGYDPTKDQKNASQTKKQAEDRVRKKTAHSFSFIHKQGTATGRRLNN